MNTLENNKLIAEFLSVKMHPCETIENFKFLPMEERGLYNGYFIEDLKYHEDWNWLMEVVEKCLVGEAEYNEDEAKKAIHEIYESLCNINISSVYNACVKFIKWYNENK